MVRNVIRDLGRLALGAAIGLPAPFLLALVLLSAPATPLGGLGLVLFAAAAWMVRRLAGLQRDRFEVPRPYRPVPSGVLPRARALLQDPATWRDLAWLASQFALGIAGVAVGFGLWQAALQCLTAPLLRALLPDPTGFDPAVLEFTHRSAALAWLLVPAGVGLVFLAYRAPGLLLETQARLARALLGPTAKARLSASVEHLTATRAAAVDASAAELRRIERDLHDGAQVRLVAVRMNIGMAENMIDADPDTAKALMAEAKASAGTALTELRDLVRGIHPPVLADRGLAGAVRALALSSAVPVDLDLRLERRLTAPVESAAYFALAECLANAIRHSGADTIRIAVIDKGHRLSMTVSDDGRGGADAGKGTGLQGIRRRLSAFDGTLRIASPAGGPTTLAMELPCAS
ncbi:sensor domain-containing protein [Dactylosporangium sp. NPDC051485]|uniref:sensor histidine kinase n=1 Tax=Dactylosporangium sp. NPDC051485 TaxID=3154846 RepID=UPI00341DC722